MPLLEFMVIYIAQPPIDQETIILLPDGRNGLYAIAMSLNL